MRNKLKRLFKFLVTPLMNEHGFFPGFFEVVLPMVIGGGAGLLGGSAGDEEQTQTSTTEVAPPQPWGPMAKYLTGTGLGEGETGLFPEAARLYGIGAQRDPRETIAGFDPAQLEAQNLMLSLARGGVPGLGQAQDLMGSILGGDYLSPDSNPYLSQYYDQAARGVTESFRDVTYPTLTSSAQGAGRYGSGLYSQLLGQKEEALGQSLGDIATNIYGPAYQFERGQQTNMMNLMPMLNQLQYMPAGMIGAVGDQRQGLEQLMRSAEVNYPWGQLGNYKNMLTGPWSGLGPGSQTTETTGTSPQDNSGLGAMAGLGSQLLMSMFGGGGGGANLGGMLGATDMMPASGGGSVAPQGRMMEWGGSLFGR